jgi:small subunit ribosomal protein S18
MRSKKRGFHSDDSLNEVREVHSMYEGAHKRLFMRTKRSCPLTGVEPSLVNYKNVKLLSRFISERGRMLPARITGLSTRNQIKVRTQIKLARLLALMPFVKY